MVAQQRETGCASLASRCSREQPRSARLSRYSGWASILYWKEVFLHPDERVADVGDRAEQPFGIVGFTVADAKEVRQPRRRKLVDALGFVSSRHFMSGGRAMTDRIGIDHLWIEMSWSSKAIGQYGRIWQICAAVP